MNEELVFEAYVGQPLIKAVGDDDRWLVHGHAASEEEDYDGDVLQRSQIVKGLQTWQAMGEKIDFDHKYIPTGELKYLIGKGVGHNFSDAKTQPVVTGELFKHKPIAKEIWEDMDKGVTFGYSIQGKGVRDSKGNLSGMKIHLITISPLAKGYDKNVSIKKGSPITGSLMGVAKALGDREALDAIFRASSCDICRETLADDMMLMYGKYPVCKACVAKSMTAGEGVVMAGDSGGGVLKKQELLGAEKAREAKHKAGQCPVCGDKTEDGKRCRKCLHKPIPAHAIVKSIKEAQIARR